MRLLMGPLAVGVVIIVLWLWLVKPVLFMAATIVVAFLLALLVSRILG